MLQLQLLLQTCIWEYKTVETDQFHRGVEGDSLWVMVYK